MLWLILVIISLLLLVAFLIFRIYTLNVSLHDVVYALLNQIVILRDACQGVMQSDRSDLMLYSFFSQGDMGDLMIKRHRLLIRYAESRDKEILVELSKTDEMLNRWMSFNMHTVSMYTISMIDKTHEGNYKGSLLAVKGFLSVIH